MWALRAQTDKLEYARKMRRLLEATPNLDIREGMAVDIQTGPNDEVSTHMLRAPACTLPQHPAQHQFPDHNAVTSSRYTPVRCACQAVMDGFFTCGEPAVESCVLMWQVTGVRTYFGITFKCRAAVITTGTFMNGRIWVGRTSMPAGRYAHAWNLDARILLCQSTVGPGRCALPGHSRMHTVVLVLFCRVAQPLF